MLYIYNVRPDKKKIPEKEKKEKPHDRKSYAIDFVINLEDWVNASVAGDGEKFTVYK